MRFGLILTTVVAIGCRVNSNYCPGANPDNNCAEIDARGPASDTPPSGCGSDGDCSAGTAVCDTTTKACVACTATEPGACTGTAPVCKQDACAPCSSHSDCASNACLPDGSCGTDANVAYVDPTGTNNANCTKAIPCTKVAAALATARPYVKFVGTTDEAVAVNGGRVVTFLAGPNAALTRSAGTGAIVTVSDTGTSLSIFDLAIKNAPNNSSGFGIVVPVAAGSPTVSLARAVLSNNPAGGISASGGSLTISQSTIANNAGGGISTTGQFAIVNNFFFANGSTSSPIGGVSILTSQNAANRLEFNSFSKNATQDGIGTAIQCVAGTFTARNNIMSGNGTLTNMNQTGGACSHAYSIATPGALPSGTGNIALDPQFVNTTTGDLHIPAGSPAVDAADPAALLTGLEGVDIDGDPRPQGVHADIGANEHKP